MADLLPVLPPIKLEGGKAEGGHVTVNALDAEALLSGIEKIVAVASASSKEKESSEKIGKDLYSLVREYIDLNRSYEEKSVKLEAALKENDYLKKKEDAIKEKERRLVALEDTTKQIQDSEKKSRENQKQALESYSKTNQEMAETNTKMLSLYLQTENELDLSRTMVEGMAENLKTAIEIHEKDERELLDKIRDLEDELSRVRRRDGATESSASGLLEEMEKLQERRKQLINDIANANNKTEGLENKLKTRENELQNQTLDDEEKDSVQNLVKKAKDQITEHQEYCKTLQEDLRKCEEQLQRHNSVDSSASGSQNSQWSAETGTSSGTALTKCSTCGSEFGPKEAIT